MPRFVVWDLDGTLIDSGADIAASANAARVALGLTPLDDATVRSYIGEGAKRLMDQAIGLDASEERRARGLELFFQHYEAHLLSSTAPYPGIDRIVHALRGRQAIATNKPSHYARRLVDGLGWSGLFASVVGGGDVPHRKPAPDAVWRALELAGIDKRDAVFVGDSPIDVECARAADIDFIAVTWGLRPRHELLAAPRLVDTPAELEEALLLLDGLACR